ncbi:UNVERIFIED_CONTAM: hypothetical protein RMT77_007814 [Armadillidium vulgare]
MKEVNGENVKKLKDPPKRKKKSYPNKFQNKWLIRFSPWLSRCEDTNIGAFCKICETKIAGSVTLIERHKKTKKHVNKCLKLGVEQMKFDEKSPSFEETKERSELDNEIKHLLSTNDEEEAINIIAEDIDHQYKDSLSTITVSDPDKKVNVRVDRKSATVGKLKKKNDISYEQTHFTAVNGERVLNESVGEKNHYNDRTSSPSTIVLNKNGNLIMKDKNEDYVHFLEHLSSKTKHEDEFELFAKSVASQLRKLPEDSSVSLIAEIQHLVSQRRLKHLNESKIQQHPISPQVITVSYENTHFNT